MMTIRDSNFSTHCIRGEQCSSRRNWIKQLISHFIHPMEAVELNNSPEKSWLSFLGGLVAYLLIHVQTPSFRTAAVAHSCCSHNRQKERWHYCPTEGKIRVKPGQHFYSTSVFDLSQTLIYLIPNNLVSPFLVFDP